MPTAEKNSVSWANPMTGIALPGSVSSDTPAAWAAAATAAVAPAATMAATAPARHSDGFEVRRCEVVD
jgi:hypothetical protein